MTEQSKFKCRYVCAMCIYALFMLDRDSRIQRLGGGRRQRQCNDDKSSMCIFNHSFIHCLIWSLVRSTVLIYQIVYGSWWNDFSFGHWFNRELENSMRKKETIRACECSSMREGQEESAGRRCSAHSLWFNEKTYRVESSRFVFILSSAYWYFYRERPLSLLFLHGKKI